MFCVTQHMMDPFQDLLHACIPGTIFLIHLIGGQVGHALQQRRSRRRDLRVLQTGITFKRLKPFISPHKPMTGDPTMALVIKGIHGGNIEIGTGL